MERAFRPRPLRLRSVTLVWVARDPRELLVVPPHILSRAAQPDGWLRLVLHCTGRLRGGSSRRSGNGGGSGSRRARGGGAGSASASSASLSSAPAPTAPTAPPAPGSRAGSRPTSALSTASSAWAHVDASLEDDIEAGLADEVAENQAGGESRDDDGGRSGACPLAPSPSARPSTAASTGDRALPPPSGSPAAPPTAMGPSPIRAYAQLDWLWILVHLLALVGASFCVCLAGSYRAEVLAYGHSHGIEPDRKHYTWRTTCLYGAGLVVGSLGFPAFFVLGPVKLSAHLGRIRADGARRARTAAEVLRGAVRTGGAGERGEAYVEQSTDKGCEISSPGEVPSAEGCQPHGLSTTLDHAAPAGPATPRRFDSAAPAEEARAHLHEGRLFLDGLDVSFPIAAGRPSVDAVVAAAAEDLGRGETLGLYAAGPDPLNVAAIQAADRVNKINKEVFVDAHRLTAML